jgi:transcription antitermination factor NusG
VAEMAKLRPKCTTGNETGRADDPATSEPRWYAVQAHVGSEVQVLHRLANKGVNAFLPCSRKKRQWSDRVKTVEVPLIPGYVFVKIELKSGLRLRTVETAGVHSFVRFGETYPDIPEDHILHLKRLSESSVDAASVPGVLCRGQRVRVRSGVLAGLEGNLITDGGARVVTIAIPAIQHSIRITASDIELEAI